MEENFTNHRYRVACVARWEADVSRSDRIGAIARHGRLEFHVPNEQVQQDAGQEQIRDSRETAAQFSYRASCLDVRSPKWSAWAAASSAGLAVERVLDAAGGGAGPQPLARLRQGDDRVPSRRPRAEGGCRRGPRARVREALAYQITDPERFDEETPSSFDFRDEGTDSEQAVFIQDQIRSGPWTFNAGLRWDRYNFLVHESAWSPRLAAARSFGAGFLVRASYDRIFQTPAVENLLLASADESDDLSDEAVRLPVRPSRGHFVEAGLSKALGGRGRLDASYFVRRLENFADDDLLLNTGVSFPMAFQRARIKGAELKLDVRDDGRWSGSLAYAYLRAIGEFPVTGGLLLDDDDSGEAGEELPISQDQRHTLRGRLRVALPRSWVAASVTYNSGLPFEEADSLEESLEQYGPRTVSRVDFEAGRVRPSGSLDFAGGVTIVEGARRSLRLYADVRNVTNRFDVINFAGLFSGTALAPPRSFGVRLAARVYSTAHPDVGPRLRAGQREEKRGTRIHLAVDPDAASVPRDDALGDVQPQTIRCRSRPFRDAQWFGTVRRSSAAGRVECPDRYRLRRSALHCRDLQREA